MGRQKKGKGGGEPAAQLEWGKEDHWGGNCFITKLGGGARGWPGEWSKLMVVCGVRGGEEIFWQRKAAGAKVVGFD